jgi:hypothetical protein
MKWEQCRNYGLITIEHKSTIRLYGDRYNSALINAPGFDTTVLSATWQGNNLIVRCLNQYNEPMGFIYRDFYEYHPI